MLTLARQAEATLVILYMGRMSGADPPIRLPEALLAGLPKEVVFVDTTDAIKRHYATAPAEPLYLTDDNPHPNARAHELFAELLQDRIAAARFLERAPGTAR